MRKLLLGPALLLMAWPAWALTCAEPDAQRGERMELELVSVSVNGVPLEDLDDYSRFRVYLQGDVDPYEADGVTRSCAFVADRLSIASSRLTERYPVEEGLEQFR